MQHQPFATLPTMNELKMREDMCSVSSTNIQYYKSGMRANSNLVQKARNKFKIVRKCNAVWHNENVISNLSLLTATVDTILNVNRFHVCTSSL